MAHPLRQARFDLVDHAEQVDQSDTPSHVEQQTITIPARQRNGTPIAAAALNVRISDEDQDGVYVVSDTFSSVYGAGTDRDEAISEYLVNLFEHLDWLERHHGPLGPALAEELTAIQQRLGRSSLA